MTDYTELKRRADELIAANDLFNESPQDNEVGDAWSLANDRFTEAASPEVIQALIAENETLTKIFADAPGLPDTDVEWLEKTRALEAERDQLKAENEALRKECDARHPFKPFHEPAIGFTGCVICGLYTDHGGPTCPKTRATAGAALGQGEQS